MRKDIWDEKRKRRRRRRKKEKKEEEKAAALVLLKMAKGSFTVSPLPSSKKGVPTQPYKMQMRLWLTLTSGSPFSRVRLSILYWTCQSAIAPLDHYFLTIDYIYSILCTFMLVKSWIFFKYSFLWGHFPPPLVPYGLRKSGGLVLTSRAQQSTALFCSEPALLPKAEINQSWLRLSRNKSRPVQSWSLPSQNVILWLSLRIN